MTFDLNLNALLEHLRESELQPELQKEHNQIFITYQLKGQDVPVFFLIQEKTNILQIVAYLPYQLHATTFGEVARMLHILNREMDLPGFGMDESEKLLFYRSVIPCFEGRVHKELFNMYLAATRLACDTFMHAIAMIASGTMKVDEALKKNT